MKVTVRNLGVLQEATVDIKPLTILIGPNNAGKTWLAYALVGIFGEYGLEQYTDAYISKNVQERYSILEDAIQQILREGSAKIDLVAFADQCGEAYFNYVADFGQHWIRRFIGLRHYSLSKKKPQVTISLTETKAHFLNQILQYALERNFAVGQGKQVPLLNVLKEAGQREMYIYTALEGSATEENSITERLPLRAIERMVISSVFGALHSALYSSTYVFPTERAAFITLPYGDYVGKKFGNEPVQRFMNMVDALFRSSLSMRTSEADKDIAVKTYMQLAQFLETHILSGTVNFSSPEPENRREILFQQAEGVSIEIPTASSMVKELSPLVLYLRYLAQSGNWLIIDEPEMNLHPGAQAKIIEFLAMLVNAGLNVLITTHSPYITDHLTNLISAASEDQSISDKFYLKSSNAFISIDNVAVYGISEGKAENVLDDDGMINWSTFGEVSEQISNIFFEL